MSENMIRILRVEKNSTHLHHVLDVLLKFRKAFFYCQQTLQPICLWVLKKIM